MVSGRRIFFDVCIFNLEADPYLCEAPEKELAKVEAEKKFKYLQPYM